MLTIIIRFNDKLVSQIMFVTLLCNFSLNIYCVTLFFVRSNLLPEEKAFLLTNIICQIYLISIACFILIQFSEKFYLCSQNIFRMASFPIIPFHDIPLKLKPNVKGKIRLALFYEVVHTNKPFRFNAGWIGNISKQTVSQFFIFYIIYLLLSLKFVNK